MSFLLYQRSLPIMYSGALEIFYVFVFVFGIADDLEWP